MPGEASHWGKVYIHIRSHGMKTASDVKQATYMKPFSRTHLSSVRWTIGDSFRKKR